VAFELDHIFVCTAPGAPEAEALLSLGMVEGTPNTHRGQGTANRRFFFHNAMLELLWVHDEAEARSLVTNRTRFLERWKGRRNGACPFGICFRPAGRGAGLPFPGWSYTPQYLPRSLSIHIGGNSERMDEPMLFHMAFGSRPDQAPAAKQQPLTHRLPLRELTRVTWVTPKLPGSSPELSAALDSGKFSLMQGSAHQLELGFDGESTGKAVSLLPGLPIKLCW
jgi:hypothetical protein